MAITDNMPGMSVNRKENHMLELRKKLSNYQEVFYLLFLLPMTGMTSMGLNSEDRIYLYVFAVATMFLLLKMAVTDFTWREIAIMAVLTLLFGLNFLRNGEKTLILTVMAIFGAKNVNLDKVMKYALWEKAVLTVGTLTLAATGVIENVGMWLPKKGTWMTVYCYGYYHPNMAMANIFVILLLVSVVYGERLKWYAYVIGTVILLAGYKVFLCKTGILAGAFFGIVVLGYHCTKGNRFNKIYRKTIIAIPSILAGLTLIIPAICKVNERFDALMYKVFTGRFLLIGEGYDQVWTLLLGHVPNRPFDNMYFTALYNYGWILFFFCLVAYTLGMWYCIKNDQYYGAIGLGIMAVYGFMELLPLSVTWNLPLLYLSQILFQGKNVRNE